jgi:ubiquinone/menaquinone biosynthesis C-methylase UbiE
MSEQSRPYAIHSDEECDRLELQARLANIQGHLKYLSVPEGGRVLDVGCGSGSMSRLIMRSFPSAQVIGVDLRQQYVDFAEARARAEGLQNLRFRQGDACALPFADASFDVAWSKYLLQWLSEPKRALAELKRVTRPGGLVVSCDFSGFAIEHFPISHEFDRQCREVMARIVDPDIGRKVAPYMLALGFADVRVDMESDAIYTVIGRIDPQRRWNWEKQWQAARPQVVKIMGAEIEADRFISRFMAFHDDPATCSYTALHFTRGRVLG